MSGMTSLHSPRDAGEATSSHVAAEVRAEMARQGLTQTDLGNCLDIAPHTAGRRFRGEVAYDLIELTQVAAWLGVPLARLLPVAAERAAS